MINSNKYEAIIFDMDGVIIDSKELVEAFWSNKLGQYAIAVPKGNKLEIKFHGRPARPTVNDLFAELSEEIQEEIVEECAKPSNEIESRIIYLWNDLVLTN